MMKKGLICVITVLLLALVFTVSCKEAIVYYNVKFNSNGGTVYKVQQVAEGDCVLKVQDPVKDGYTFEGWYSDPEFMYKYDFNKPVHKDMTLYAKWGSAFDPEDYMILSGSTWFDAFQGEEIKKADVTKIIFEKTNTSGSDRYVDLSKKQNENVKGYLKSDSQAGKYIIHIVSDYVYGSKDCSDMFCNFTKLTSITFGNFDTSDVTDMKYMFSNCFELKHLDVSSFNTSNVTDMSFMFFAYDGESKSKLTSITFGSKFNTSNVTSMGCMFYGCESLTSLDVSSFNTSKVIYMNNMFYGCSELKSITFGSKFDTSNVTDMDYMFRECSSLTSLDVSSFNTSNVTDMDNMFYGCSSLTSLDVSGFDTSKVTNMNNMFRGCSSLTSLDVSSFNTSKVTNMNNMFRGCSSLTSLDVSSFNTSKVTEMTYMFYGCEKLKTIYASNNFKTTQVTASNNMFNGCTSLVGGNGTNYNSNYVDKTYARIDGGESNPGYFTAPPDPYTLKKQDTWFEAFSLAGKSKSEITQIVFAKSLPSGLSNQIGPVCVGENGYTGTDTSKGVVGYYGEKTVGSTTEKIIYIVGQTIKGNADSSYMFSFTSEPTLKKSDPEPNCFKNLKSIDFSDVFNTSNVTNMRHMFSCCSALADLDLSSWNRNTAGNTSTTSNVTDMAGMFLGCYNDVDDDDKVSEADTGLTSITFGDVFDTSKVVTMEEMFQGCQKLESLDVSKFETSNVTDMSYMFNFCSVLDQLDVSKFKTENVTNMKGMFQECGALESLSVKNFKTSKVTDMCHMFSECYSLASLDLSSFDTSSVTSMDNMFSTCKGLTSLDLSSFDVTSTDKRTSVPTTAYMFYLCGPVGTQLTVTVNVSAPNTEARWGSVLSGFTKGTTVSGKTPYTRTRSDS